MKTIVTLATTLACALILAACGGGGGGGDDSTVASNNSGGGSSQSAGTGTGSNGSSTGTGSGGSGTSTGSSSNSGTGAGSGSSSTGTGTGSGGSGTSTGSSGDSSTGAGNNGSDTGSTGSNTLTYSYEAVTPSLSWLYASNMVSDVNAVGQTEYRWLSMIEEYASSTNQGFYVKDSRSHHYAFAMVLQPPDQATYDLSATAFLNQLNFEGGQGYRYAGSKLLTLDASGNLQDYNFYIKDTDSTATYSYILDTSTVNNDKSNFLTQANGHGELGYLYRGVKATDSTLNLNMYEKDSTSNAYYTYQALSISSGDTIQAQWLTQASSQGAQGYSALLYGSSSNLLPSGWIYVKDTNQSATFTYQSVVDPEAQGSIGIFGMTNAGVIGQANIFGAQGYWFLGEFNVNLVFIQPINCTNFQLCDPRSLQSY